MSNERSEGRSVTRTLAILAQSACSTHRQAIQTQIVSNGFSILNERLEQWSLEQDADFLDAFFGGDLGMEQGEKVKWSKRLTAGSIYLMALERSRAVDVWMNLCGPDVEGDEQPLDEQGLSVAKAGLRAEYGADAVYAPASAQLADHQIAICFPELATREALAKLQIEAQGVPATITAIDSNGGFLVREDDDIVYDEQGQAFDAHNGEPLELQQEVSVVHDPASPNKGIGTNGETGQRMFKARPLPSSYKQATANQPRLSRAAALRMGIALPSPPKRAPSSISSGQQDSTLGISGLPKANVDLPKSLAAPSIAPRMNKNAAARTGKVTQSSPPTSSDKASVASRERKPVDFSNTPGHKRISTGGAKLASLAAPTVAPRLNKAASARVAAGGGNLNASSVSASPSSTSYRPSRPMSLASSSSYGQVSNAASSSPSAIRKPVDFSNTPGHKRASLSTSTNATLKSLQAPSIAPRANRTSLARGGASSDSQAKSPVAIKAALPSQTSVVSSVSGGGKENRVGAQAGPRPASAVARERRPVDYSTTPGHKRASSTAKIASLAAPTIAPRTNLASQRRLSVGGLPGTATQTSNGPAAGRMNLRTAAPPSSFRV